MSKESTDDVPPEATREQFDQYEQETVALAEKGDREAALSILDDVAAALELGLPPHPVYARYVASAFRGAIERNESVDALLNIKKAKQRPPQLWRKRVGPLQLMTAEYEAIEVATRVAMKIRSGKKPEVAKQEVAEELRMGSNTVRNTYQKWKEPATEIAALRLRDIEVAVRVTRKVEGGMSPESATSEVAEETGQEFQAISDEYSKWKESAKELIERRREPIATYQLRYRKLPSK